MSDALAAIAGAARAPRAGSRHRVVAVLAALLLVMAGAACEPNPYAGAQGPRIGVIGDSLVVGIEGLATAQLRDRGWNPSVSGHAGFTVANEFDTVTRLMTTNPQVVVLALGTNDLKGIDNGTQTWDGFRNDVATALGLADGGSCVVWVGVNEYNGTFEHGITLGAFGWVINWIINVELARTGRRNTTAFYADWAAASRGRMDYFSAPGDPHLTAAGNQAYTDLIIDTAGRCPGAPIFGNIDAVSDGNSVISASGWVIDPDTTGPVDVHAYLDGTFAAVVTASQYRPDVDAVFGRGANHGFSLTAPASDGSHRLCLYAINVGPPGDNPLLGCRDVTVRAVAFGSLDEVRSTEEAVHVSGWAIDPGTTASIAVQIVIDGAGVTTIASTARPDVALAYPAFGADHGYTLTLAADEGRHTVCAYAISASTGTPNPLGCREVVVDDD